MAHHLRCSTNLLNGICSFAALFTMGGALAAAPPKREPLVKLDIEKPRYRRDLPLSVQFSSGWPVVFKLQANMPLGVATNVEPPEFPRLGSTGYVVFEDPTPDCLSLPPPFDDFDDCVGPQDETYLEFTNDVDKVGVPDEPGAGNPSRRVALADPSHSGPPVFEAYGTGPATLGPDTGGSVADSVGYGSDDDLPGLVVLAPHGPGLRLNRDFTAPPVRLQVNLGGFLNWVSYELNSATRQTAVHAGMVVPYGLIAPLMLADDCVTIPPADPLNACNGAGLYRLDGNPTVRTAQGAFRGSQSSYPTEFNSATFELRAFVVSGVAPSVLRDMDGDGDVDSRDATAMGHRVISNEERIELRQYHGNTCGTGFPVNVYFADIDGNGLEIDTLVCPPGPGQIRQVPN